MEKFKVLIALDEPEQAKVIFYSAFNIINRDNTEIYLLNVVESSPEKEELFYKAPDRYIEHEADKSKLVFIEDFLTNEGLEYGFISKEGDVTETILHFSQELKVDLVVLGTHNKKGIEKFLLGSVAYKVARLSKVSVLLVGSHCELHTQKEEPFRVLLGADNSDYSYYAVDNLNKYIDKERARVTLLNVIQPPQDIIPPDAYGYVDMSALIRETETYSISLLEDLSERLCQEGIFVENKKYLRGDPANTIIETAHDENYDLVVLGSQGKGNISRWMLGSVSTKVYEYSDKPVLIIKKEKRP